MPRLLKSRTADFHPTQPWSGPTGPDPTRSHEWMSVLPENGRSSAVRQLRFRVGGQTPSFHPTTDVSLQWVSDLTERPRRMVSACWVARVTRFGAWGLAAPKSSWNSMPVTIGPTMEKA